MNKIFFVTVFYIPHDMLNLEETSIKRPKEWQSYLYKRVRCWGWFEKETDAEKCIKENWTDIYENGYYNLALIEPATQGPTGLATRNARWFKVEYINEDTYDIKEIKRPKRFNNLCGFSYA